MAFDRARGRTATRTLKLLGFLVHILTALGAACAFLALVEAINGVWPRMFEWLGIALVIDAVDGPLARAVRVAEFLPRWSGETLDLVVDFMTYVFVPAYAIAASGLMPDVVAILAGLVIVVTGAIYFADRQMKTFDNYFRGFPALWNAVAFYLLLLAPSPWITAGIVASLAVLTFVPFPFIHPLRVTRLRTVNFGVLVLWSLLALATLYQNMAPGPWITGALCAIGLYVFGAGLLRPARARTMEGRRYDDGTDPVDHRR
jgi:phosphatidylcholine synthase